LVVPFAPSFILEQNFNLDMTWSAVIAQLVKQMTNEPHVEHLNTANIGTV
jgi:hypothetical protein